MKSTFIKISALVGLSLFSFSSFAQYSQGWRFSETTHKKKDKLKLIQRLELGYHSGFNKVNFHQNTSQIFPVYDGAGNHIGYTDPTTFDWTYKLNAISYGGNIGVTIPVGRIAPKTSIGFNVDVYGTMTTYKFVSNSIFGMPAQPTVNLKSTTINIPLGLDIKWGGQSTLSKDDWASVGFGGGIAPTIVMMTPKEFSDNSKMLVRPYLKAEFGFRTGIFWKIKGMVLFNSTTLGEITTGEINNVGPYTPYVNSSVRTNGHTYLLGLSVNLGSGGWTKSW